jgi:hypothetical protein
MQQERLYLIVGVMGDRDASASGDLAQKTIAGHTSRFL